MKRKLVYFGEPPSPTPRILDRKFSQGLKRDVWPSIRRLLGTGRSRRGSGTIDPGTSDFFPSERVNGRAVSLAPDTDVDELLVFFDDKNEPEYLGPGGIIRRDFSSLRIEPARGFPSTKATQKGVNLFSSGRQTFTLPNGQRWRCDVEQEVTTPATKAHRAAWGGGTAFDTDIEAVTAGSDGNSISIKLVGNSAPGAGVVIDDSGAPAYLIHFESGVSTIADVEAAIGALSGSLIDVRTPGTGAHVLVSPGDEFTPSNLAGGTDPGVSTQFVIILDAADGPVQTYRWNGTTWVVDAVIAVGAQWVPTGATAATFVLADGDGTETRRPIDYTPIPPGSTAPQVNFMELLLAGIIPVVDNVDLTNLDNLPALFRYWRDSYFWCSLHAASNEGTPGQGGGSVFAAHSSYTRYIEDCWFQSAGLMVYDECPSAGERARLLPERRYVFDQYFIQATPAELEISDTTTDVLATFPTFNVEKASFIARATSGNTSVWAAFMHRTPMDNVEDARADMLTPDPPATTTNGGTIAISIAIEDYMGGFLSIGLGTDDTANSLAAGAELVLRRKHIG